jgi:hypothetical protein
MSLNLKPVLNTQTDNEKLDVVNYNFDQIVNNGGGPKGYQGATGSQGLTGLTGAQGSQGNTGPTGVQGFQGAAAADLWKTNTSPASNTLVPKHGTPTNPPTVMYGVDKLDPLYNSVFDEAAVLLNRKSTAYGYNLELTDDGVTAADGNRIIYSLADIAGVSTFQMGFYNTTSGNPTNWKLYSDDFAFSDGTNNFASIGSGGFNIFVPSQFRNAATFNNTVRINSGNPGAGKILTSTDTLGTVAWKSISEIGGVVPVGTIVPILTSIFDDDTLFYKDAISNTLSSGQKLKIRHGAGYGAYNGWYLCNGQTWLSGTGNSKTVPNLCSFDYEIDDNTADTAPGGQFGAQGSTPNLAIVGGSNVLMTADYASGTSDYLIEDIITSSSVTIHTNASGTPVYDLTKLVYIIYIGEGGWFWQDGGTTGGATVTHYYLLYRYFSSSSNTTSVNYTTSPASTYTTTDTAGTTVSISITCTPNSGFAFTSASNISLWAPTGGSIFGVSPDASVTQSSSVLNPNGTITLTLSDSSYPASTDPTTSNLIILGSASASASPNALSVRRSTVGFAGSTSGSWSNQTIYVNGTNNLSQVNQIYATSSLNSSPTPGWYAQNISTGWCYRYWNGSSFGTMNMTGVNIAPGSWTQQGLYVDSMFVYGGVGGYPSAYSTGTDSACDTVSTALFSSGPYTSTNIWSSISAPSGMTNYSECYVVADAYSTGNQNYDSIDFTDNMTESGYISPDPCLGMFQYAHGAGVLKKIPTSCAAVNPGYDTGFANYGDCIS